MNYVSMTFDLSLWFPQLVAYHLRLLHNHQLLVHLSPPGHFLFQHGAEGWGRYRVGWEGGGRQLSRAIQKRGDLIKECEHRKDDGGGGGEGQG